MYSPILIASNRTLAPIASAIAMWIIACAIFIIYSRFGLGGLFPVTLDVPRDNVPTVKQLFTLLLSRHKKNPYHVSSRGLGLGRYDERHGFVASYIRLIVTLFLDCAYKVMLFLVRLESLVKIGQVSTGFHQELRSVERLLR